MQEGFIEKLSRDWERVRVADDDLSEAASAPMIPSESKEATVGLGLSMRVGSAAIEVRPGFDPPLFPDVPRVMLALSGTDPCRVRILLAARRTCEDRSMACS